VLCHEKLICKAHRLTRVNEGSQLYRPPTRLSISGMNHACLFYFSTQLQCVTALWPVLIFRPAEGRRLSWPETWVRCAVQVHCHLDQPYFRIIKSVANDAPETSERIRGLLFCGIYKCANYHCYYLNGCKQAISPMAAKRYAAPMIISIISGD